MRVVHAIMKYVFGHITTEETVGRKRTELCGFATADQLAGIAAAVFLMLLLLAEAVAREIGLRSDGRLASVISPRYFETGILGGWRNGVSTVETVGLLVVVGTSRVSCILLENRINKRYRQHSKTYLELLIRDGPASFREMCATCLIASLFVGASEFALYGKEKRARASDTDDDETSGVSTDEAAVVLVLVATFFLVRIWFNLMAEQRR